LKRCYVLARGLSRGWWAVHAFLVLALISRESRNLRAHLAWLKITLPSGASRRFYVSDFTQAVALGEVFLEDEYKELPPSQRISTILDLGSNAGQAAVYLRGRFPEARILAVEADPVVARLTALNMRGDLNAVVVSAAVADHDGVVWLTRWPGASWGSNVLAAWESSGTYRIEVRSVMLASLMREHSLDSVDLLKIDVEGAEMMALASDDALTRVGYVIGEFHPTLLDMTAEESVEALRAHGRFASAEMHSDRIFILSRDAGESAAPANSQLAVQSRLAVQPTSAGPSGSGSALGHVEDAGGAPGEVGEAGAGVGDSGFGPGVVGAPAVGFGLDGE
jgi:FkbM family methyltransferase